MANEVATVAAPAAPAEPAAPVILAPPIPATQATSVKDARAALRPGGVSGTVAEAKAAIGGPPPVTPPAEPDAAASSAVGPAGQPRNPDGTFAPATTNPAPDAPADAAVAGSAKAAAPAAEPTQTPDAASVVPAGHVRIPIPAGHPLAERGLAWRDVPEADADYHRWAINNTIRRNDLESAVSYARQLERENMQLRATTSALQDPAVNPMLSKDVQEAAAEIERVFGKERADAYRAGEQQKLQAAVNQRTQQAIDEQANQQLAQEAEQWMNTTFTQARGRYEHWSNQDIVAAMGAYGSLIDGRGQHAPSMAEFIQFADAQYLMLPKVQAEMQSRLATQQAADNARVAAETKQQLEAQERVKLEQQAQERLTNPFGRIPAGVAEPKSIPVPGAGTQVATVQDARKALFSLRAVR